MALALLLAIIRSMDCLPMTTHELLEVRKSKPNQLLWVARSVEPTRKVSRCADLLTTSTLNNLIFYLSSNSIFCIQD
uniref:Secreted protein n=1 Tax=Ditylenchus dipsaci TaxID=166011 RepID=A0A915DZ08_9BILA